MSRHFLAPTDISHAERHQILSRAQELKADQTPAGRRNLRVGSLFFNPSLRTRISFEQAVYQLGGNCQTLNASADSWGLEFDPHAIMDQDKAENVVEAAGVLGRYFHVLGVRAFPTSLPWKIEKQEPVLRAFADHSGIPVVSLEGALHHPCQSLADHLTMVEHFGENLQGMPVTLSWAYHPNPLPMAVPHSFALQAALAGCNLTIAHPPGYDLDADVVSQIHASSKQSGGSVRITNDQADGLKKAKVVYVKSWGAQSLWHDKDAERNHRKPYRGWILNDNTWQDTDEAKVMHCLPVRRNVVIGADILDSPRSIVLDEAENRLWAQAALIEFLANTEGVL